MNAILNNSFDNIANMGNREAQLKFQSHNDNSSSKKSEYATSKFKTEDQIVISGRVPEEVTHKQTQYQYTTAGFYTPDGVQHQKTTVFDGNKVTSSYNPAITIESYSKVNKNI